jgi:hypothetical protein
MTEPVYRCRLSLYRKGEDTFSMSDAALAVSGGGRDRTLAYTDIRAVRVYESPGVGSFPGFARCVLWPRRGRAVVISSNHFLGLGRFEDRSAQFRPFVDALVRRIAAASRETRFVFGMPRALWWFWIAILAAVALLAPLALVMIVVELANGRSFPVQGLIALGIVFTVFLSLLSYIRHLRRNRPRFYLVMTGLALAVMFVTLTMMLVGRARSSPLAYVLLVGGAAAGAFYQGAMLLESWPRRCDPHGTDWHDVWTRL